jgi:hypothetical protein
MPEPVITGRTSSPSDEKRDGAAPDSAHKPLAGRVNPTPVGLRVTTSGDVIRPNPTPVGLPVTPPPLEPRQPRGLLAEPRAGDGTVDPRILAAWREWLVALATDAEAAMAAAHVYAELAPEVRDAWLDALVEDAKNLAVPPVAIYAPLLSVERDPARRARIQAAVGGDESARVDTTLVRAVRGIAADGSRLVSLVTPLYLSFVQVLSCRFHPDHGFVWVRHDPLLRAHEAPSAGWTSEDVLLEATPLKPVIEELAHAILAERRRGGELPESLRRFSDLFGAYPDT